jgi:GNAT superfamily N-acetyltransferase
VLASFGTRLVFQVKGRRIHEVVSELRFRAAIDTEAQLLSDLAFRAKGHWGYDAAFLEACRAELTIDPAPIRQGSVTVATRDDTVIGFYALEGEGRTGHLVDLFVEPDAIRTGVGSALIAHALQVARAARWERLRIEADPYARPFYERHGARLVGEVPSGSIPGRMLPLLEVDL